MRRKLQAILIVVLLQFIWAIPQTNGWDAGVRRRRALKISFGFPFSCLSYTTVRTTGQLSEFENYPERPQWLPGFDLRPNLLVMDTLLGVFEFFLLMALLEEEIGRRALQGIALSIAAAILVAAANSITFPQANTPLDLAIILLFLPGAACFLTRRNSSPWHSFVLVIAVAFVLPLMTGRFEQFRPDHGFSFDAKSNAGWQVTDEDLYLPFILVIVIGVPTFMARKFLPVFRAKKSNDCALE